MGRQVCLGVSRRRMTLLTKFRRTQRDGQRQNFLAAEKAALGFYITGHPLEKHFDLLQSLKAVKSSELLTMTTGSRVVAGGVMGELQIRTTKKGDKFALLRLEDEAGGTKCVLWPEVYRKHSACFRTMLRQSSKGRLELSEDNSTNDNRRPSAVNGRRFREHGVCDLENARARGLLVPLRIDSQRPQFTSWRL